MELSYDRFSYISNYKTIKHILTEFHVTSSDLTMPGVALRARREWMGRDMCYVRFSYTGLVT